MRSPSGNVAPTSDADNVVSNRFPLSPSIEAACAAVIDRCVAEHKLLESQSREREDETWATGIEAKLRAHIAAEGPDVAVRRLECRTTVCAVEITSLHGHLQ